MTEEAITMKCCRCGEHKTIDLMAQLRGKPRGYCKACVSDASCKYYEKNKEACKERHTAWLLSNKEQTIEYSKKYREEHTESISRYMDSYRQNKKDEINATRREYYENHKDTIRRQNRLWYCNNKIKHHKYRAAYLGRNLNARIAAGLRQRLAIAVKSQARHGKGASAVSNLGCSVRELIMHLERQFYNNPTDGHAMSWGSYGLYGWHIDHIQPLCSFDLSDTAQCATACHFTNLQPMWCTENLSKGGKWLKN